MSDIIKISELPVEIRRSIPYSIRMFSDIHYIEDLPVDIRSKVREYLQRDKSVSYDVVYDAVPKVSEYGDFQTIDDIYNLVTEYLRNYLMVSENAYPFDANFYSRLKHYIQKKDTALQHRLVSNEIQEIINSISTDLDISINLVDLTIQKGSDAGYGVVYFANATIRINNVEKSMNLKVQNQ